MQRSCVECERGFTGRLRNQACCSAVCSHTHNNKQQNLKRKTARNTDWSDVVCKECGRQRSKKHSKQVFCSLSCKQRHSSRLRRSKAGQQIRDFGRAYYRRQAPVYKCWRCSAKLLRVRGPKRWCDNCRRIQQNENQTRCRYKRIYGDSESIEIAKTRNQIRKVRINLRKGKL